MWTGAWCLCVPARFDCVWPRRLLTVPSSQCPTVASVPEQEAEPIALDCRATRVDVPQQCASV